METIRQETKTELIQTRKTVDWLVNNTTVSVFDPITFEGYQRDIDERHCEKIVSYLRDKEFFLPTAITCATDGEFTESTPLRIVDGQHRVKAFGMLRENHRERYDQIRDLEVPVIVMAKVDPRLEIDTFVTINKTSKKVDTSLALVLKNKMNKFADSTDLTVPKSEFMAVEMAKELNQREGFNNPWFDKILFEGNPKNTAQLISLNAFVRSTRVLINRLAKKGLISLAWANKEDITKCTNQCCEMMLRVWSAIEYKWPGLFHGEPERKRIIQGAIGYTAFNKVLINLLDTNSFDSMGSFLAAFERHLSTATYDAQTWMPGNQFSKFTSESGYSIVARDLMRDMNMKI